MVLVPTLPAHWPRPPQCIAAAQLWHLHWLLCPSQVLPAFHTRGRGSPSVCSPKWNGMAPDNTPFTIYGSAVHCWYGVVHALPSCPLTSDPSPGRTLPCTHSLVVSVRWEEDATAATLSPVLSTKWDLLNASFLPLSRSLWLHVATTSYRPPPTPTTWAEERKGTRAHSLTTSTACWVNWPRPPGPPSTGE